MEVRVNKLRDQNIERKQRRDEKLGRTTLKTAEQSGHSLKYCISTTHFTSEMTKPDNN